MPREDKLSHHASPVRVPATPAPDNAVRGDLWVRPPKVAACRNGACWRRRVCSAEEFAHLPFGGSDAVGCGSWEWLMTGDLVMDHSLEVAQVDRVAAFAAHQEVARRVQRTAPDAE